jgi:hypothetical protein
MARDLKFCMAALILVSFLLPVTSRSQNNPNSDPAWHQKPMYDKPGEKFGPAPKHDISGTWEPAEGPNAGTQADGAQLMPSDGKPEHDPPFTPAGREAYLKNKPSVGVNMVLSALTNDPVKGGVTGNGCDPVGFPRIALYNYRTNRIIQTPDSVVILYTFNKKWRIIRTDVSELPKELVEPLWFGYSTGRWEDDYTFVAHAAGFDDRTWLDAAGRPHSEDLRVEERYKRTDREHLLVTITIDDPQMYTKPWKALNLSFRLQPPSLQIHEMECAPSETLMYNQLFGNPTAGIENRK